MIINNGAAGMPNFKSALSGLATRIARSPSEEALYSVRAGDVFVEAVALHYDHAAWQRRFLAQWPADSDAYLSYYRRIVEGPDYSPDQAVRPHRPPKKRASVS